MGKRLGGILLTLALALTLAPMMGGEAKAANTPTHLYIGVNGHAVSIKYKDIIGGGSVYGSTSSGTAQYNPSTNTLTLTNYDLPRTGDAYTDGMYYSADDKQSYAIYCDGDLTILVSGTNTLTPSAYGYDLNGIYVNGNLTIKNVQSVNGTLITHMYEHDGNESIYHQTVTHSTGIRCTGTLTIQNNTSGSVTVNATGCDAMPANITPESRFQLGSYGIRAKNLTVSSGTVTATGGSVNVAASNAYSCGILSFGAVNLTTSESVTARGGTAFKSRGIIINGSGTTPGSLTSSCRSLTAEGGGADRSGSSSIGIEAYYQPSLNNYGEIPCEVTFTAGTATVKGGAAASTSCGISMSTGTLTVNGTAAVTASAAGGSCSFSEGIVTSDGGTVLVKGGTLAATGGGGDQVRLSYGIEAGTVKVEGGTVTATGNACRSNTSSNAISAGINIRNANTNRYSQSGGTVTATGGAATTTGTAATQSTGVWVQNGRLNISGGTLSATGGTATGGSGKSWGVYCWNQHIHLESGGRLEASGQTSAIAEQITTTVTTETGWPEDWACLFAPIIFAGADSGSATLRPYGGQYISGAHYSDKNDYIYGCKYVLAGPSGTGGKNTSEVPKRSISSYTLTLQNQSFVYDGKEKTQPVPTRFVRGGVDIINSLTISGNKATGAGTHTVYLTAKSTSSCYAGSTSANWTINKANNPITAHAVTIAKGGNAVDLTTAISGAQGSVTYAITGAANGCSVSGSTFTSGAATGAVTVTANAGGNNNYKSGMATITVTVTDKANVTASITEGAALTKLLGDRDFTLHAAVTGASGGTWTWSSGDTSVATVTSTGTVHILKTGTAVVTARYEDGSHIGAATLTLTVGAMQKPTVSVSGTMLQWSATLPDSGKSATVLAAWYNSSGRMVGTTSKAITASGAASGTLAVGTGSGYTYKLLIVDTATYVPLCAAWSSP